MPPIHRGGRDEPVLEEPGHVSQHSPRPSLPVLICGLLFLAGCGEAITGNELPNSCAGNHGHRGPTAVDACIGTVVTFYWDGFDPDGEIVGFEWRISDNGPDGVVDPTDTLTMNLPWIPTTALDSTFAVTADLPGFQDDIDDSVSVRYTRSWQSHTFFIRAIDERGASDPTPAMVSFTSTTLTPSVTITMPNRVQPNNCSTAPPGLAFAWDARDPDSEDTRPEAIRYLLKRYGGSEALCMLQHQYESGHYPIDVDDPDWSPWIRHDAPLDSGKAVRFPIRPKSDVGTSYVFAIQARDRAGAVTPTFEWGLNVRHFKITDTMAPHITVSEPLLGSHEFIHTQSWKRFTVASSQPVSISWSATAESYGNLIEGYRYGFNLIDPDDPEDPGWVVPWGKGEAWTRAAPRTLTLGSPNFVVQAVDSSNQLSRATFFFQVVETGRRSEQRSLLIVDDTPKEVLVETSQIIDRKWDTSWRRLIQGIGVVGFGAGDMIDATEDADQLTFSLLNQYRAVIWHIGPGKSFYRSELGPGSAGFNWLTVYQRDVGNLLVAGAGTVAALSGSHSSSTRTHPVIWGTGASYPQDDNVAFHNFCVSALDMVRPFRIYGESPGTQLRDRKCATIVYAAPDAGMLAEYETSAINVPALRPNDLRRFGAMKYHSRPGGYDPTELNTTAFQLEEFYNVNVTSLNVTVTLRDCQVPMYRAIARRDVDEPSIYENEVAAGWVEMGLGVEPALVDSVLWGSEPQEWVDNCVSRIRRPRRETSVVSLQPVGLVSNVFSGRGGRPATKQEGTLLTSDFLWGFNPVQFQSTTMRTALRWAILDHWRVNDDL